MFGERLRSLRENRGLRSQQALADVLGVAQSTVANWEGGRREPSCAVIIRLADYFQVTLDYLLGRSNDPQGGTVTDEMIQSALWGDVPGLTEEDRLELWEDVREYALYRLRHRRRREEREARG